MTGTNTALKVGCFTDPPPPVPVTSQYCRVVKKMLCMWTLQICTRIPRNLEKVEMEPPHECGPKIPVCPMSPTRKVTIEFKVRLWVKTLGHKFYFVFMKMPTLPPEGLSYYCAKILRKHLKYRLSLFEIIYTYIYLSTLVKVISDIVKTILNYI